MARFVFVIFAAAATLLPYVAAHGYVAKMKIDSKTYNGNNPFIDPKKKVSSPIRFIDTTFPVTGANNKNIICGPNAQKAPLVADANPGSVFAFTWRETPSTHWAHEAGPEITYMASCRDTPCNEFNAASAEWFKIDQLGKKKNSADWYQLDTQKGQDVTVTLPDNIKAGGYLIRHEIIALHNATHIQGAQFYPACIQVNIGGNEDGVPQKGDLARFPGAYGDMDPGLYSKDASRWYVPDSVQKYVFPGPPVATLSSSGSATEDAPSSSSGTVSSPSTASSVSTTSSASKPTKAPAPIKPAGSQPNCHARRMVKRSARAFEGI